MSEQKPWQREWDRRYVRLCRDAELSRLQRRAYRLYLRGRSLPEIASALLPELPPCGASVRGKKLFWRLTQRQNAEIACAIGQAERLIGERNRGAVYVAGERFLRDVVRCVRNRYDPPRPFGEREEMASDRDRLPAARPVIADDLMRETWGGRLSPRQPWGAMCELMVQGLAVGVENGEFAPV